MGTTPQTVIFDLDGTLADTSGDLIAAANACFRQLGHGDLLDPVTDAHTAFRGGRAMLRLGLARLGAVDEAAVDRAFPYLLEFYGENIAVHSAIYPGAVAAVERLRAQGTAVGICTNKPEWHAEKLLAALGVRDLFGAVIGADTLATRKPDPAPYFAAVNRAGGMPSRSMLLGDTETDRATARAAGVPCALVTFGPDGAAVAELAPEGLLDHYDELDALVAQLIG